MKEIICIHIGQCGIQLGNSSWELFCLEHGIQLDGQIFRDKSINHEINEDNSSLFQEIKSGKYVPRSIFIDLDPIVVNEVRTGTYKMLFHPNNLISGKEDASNIFPRGSYTLGKELLLDISLDRIRKLADNCSNLQGFLIFRSTGGGTGSGLGSQILSILQVDYDKKLKLGITVFPSPQISTSVVEPYNSVLDTHSWLCQDNALNIVLDNQAIYNICQNKLDIENPSYTNLNQLTAQIISSLTTSIRFNGTLNTNLNELYTNLIPYPRLNFMLTSQAPYVSCEKYYYEQSSTYQISNSVFDSDNMMAKCDPRRGKYMACCMLYKGDIIPQEVHKSIAQLKSKKTIQFVDWCPTGFKIGINKQLPIIVKGNDLSKVARSVCMISNSTAISQTFEKMSYKFDQLYAKRAFVHWFVSEGMEECEFYESLSDVQYLLKDYEEVGVETKQFDNLEDD
ncbi:hypothetical protein ABPG72_021306 [Tetrahymena utriculariae]